MIEQLSQIKHRVSAIYLRDTPLRYTFAIYLSASKRAKCKVSKSQVKKQRVYQICFLAIYLCDIPLRYTFAIYLSASMTEQLEKLSREFIRSVSELCMFVTAVS